MRNHGNSSPRLEVAGLLIDFLYFRDLKHGLRLWAILLLHIFCDMPVDMKGVLLLSNEGKEKDVYEIAGYMFIVSLI